MPPGMMHVPEPIPPGVLAMQRFSRRKALGYLAASAAVVAAPALGVSQEKGKAKVAKKAKVEAPVITYPPKLPDGAVSITDTAPEFLQPPETLKSGVAIAKTPPTVDFQYFPG